MAELKQFRGGDDRVKLISGGDRLA